MSAWVVVDCLLTLRAEFNALAPNRDKGADGTIGDSSHASSSDHTPDEDSDVLRDHDADSKNEVHALDIDVDLNHSTVTLEACVQRILAQARAGDRRLKYIIFNRRIWSASSGWAQRTYTGSDPHTNHAHFSASYVTSQEASTASWHLGDLVALTEPELDQIETRAFEAARRALSSYGAGSLPAGGGSRDGALTTLLTRTNYLSNVFAPLVVTALAEADGPIDLSDEDLDVLSDRLIDALPEALVLKVAEKLRANPPA